MKKAVKIVGITLASLVGVVLIAAAVALTILNSSERLTKMVKKYAPQWIECDMELGEAKLNLFKDRGREKDRKEPPYYHIIDRPLKIRKG